MSNGPIVNDTFTGSVSAEPGQWDTSRAEYLRGVMDAISDPTVTRVVVAKGSQVGYTECLGNIIGFHIDQDPAPILVVQPTVEMAEAWSKDRLAPMIRDTPCLAGKVQSPLTRDSGNTLARRSSPVAGWRSSAPTVRRASLRVRYVSSSPTK